MRREEAKGAFPHNASGCGAWQPGVLPGTVPSLPSAILSTSPVSGQPKSEYAAGRRDQSAPPVRRVTAASSPVSAHSQAP